MNSVELLDCMQQQSADELLALQLQAREFTAEHKARERQLVREVNELRKLKYNTRVRAVFILSSGGCA